MDKPLLVEAFKKIAQELDISLTPNYRVRRSTAIFDMAILAPSGKPRYFVTLGEADSSIREKSKKYRHPWINITHENQIEVVLLLIRDTLQEKYKCQKEPES